MPEVLVAPMRVRRGIRFVQPRHADTCFAYGCEDAHFVSLLTLGPSYVGDGAVRSVVAGRGSTGALQ